MSERKTLLLLIHDFLNYLIDKFHPRRLVNEGFLFLLFRFWPFVGFYSSTHRNQPLDVILVIIMRRYIGKVENP